MPKLELTTNSLGDIYSTNVQVESLYNISCITEHPLCRADLIIVVEAQGK